MYILRHNCSKMRLGHKLNWNTKEESRDRLATLEEWAKAHPDAMTEGRQAQLKSTAARYRDAEDRIQQWFARFEMFIPRNHCQAILPQSEEWLVEDVLHRMAQRGIIQKDWFESTAKKKEPMMLTYRRIESVEEE